MGKVFKNSCKNLVFLILSAIYTAIIIAIYFLFELPQELFIIALLISLSPFIIYFGLGFYWVFQSVLIDENGITFYLFGKRLIGFSWEEIEEISIENHKISKYLIKIKNQNKYYSIDLTKRIKYLMDKNAPIKLMNR